MWEHSSLLWESILRGKGGLTQRIGTDNLSGVNCAARTMDAWRFHRRGRFLAAGAVRQVASQRLGQVRKRWGRCRRDGGQWEGLVRMSEREEGMAKA